MQTKKIVLAIICICIGTTMLILGRAIVFYKRSWNIVMTRENREIGLFTIIGEENVTKHGVLYDVIEIGRPWKFSCSFDKRDYRPKELIIEIYDRDILVMRKTARTVKSDAYGEVGIVNEEIQLGGQHATLVILDGKSVIYKVDLIETSSKTFFFSNWERIKSA
jgi:hypothetical protein